MINFSKETIRSAFSAVYNHDESSFIKIVKDLFDLKNADDYMDEKNAFLILFCIGDEWVINAFTKTVPFYHVNKNNIKGSLKLVKTIINNFDPDFVMGFLTDYKFLPNSSNESRQNIASSLYKDCHLPILKFFYNMNSMYPSFNVMTQILNLIKLAVFEDNVEIVRFLVTKHKEQIRKSAFLEHFILQACVNTGNRCFRFLIKYMSIKKEDLYSYEDDAENRYDTVFYLCINQKDYLSLDYLIKNFSWESKDIHGYESDIIQDPEVLNIVLSSSGIKSIDFKEATEKYLNENEKADLAVVGSLIDHNILKSDRLVESCLTKKRKYCQILPDEVVAS